MNLIKITTSQSENSVKKSRYSEIKKMFIKFLKIHSRISNGQNTKNFKPNSKNLYKLLAKILRSVEITDRRYKLTYSSFLKSVKHQLFTHLYGINYDET
jgi:hypothetical protein